MVVVVVEVVEVEVLEVMREQGHDNRRCSRVQPLAIGLGSSRGSARVCA